MDALHSGTLYAPSILCEERRARQITAQEMLTSANFLGREQSTLRCNHILFITFTILNLDECVTNFGFDIIEITPHEQSLLNCNMEFTREMNIALLRLNIVEKQEMVLCVVTKTNITLM